MAAPSLLEGPIPGENFTSDTKNYPWHRPPEITDLDKAVEEVAKKVMSEPLCFDIITLLELKVPVVSIAGIVAMQGISAGKWSVDYAILLAGPICHIIMIMAESYGVKYVDGLKVDQKIKTKAYFDMANRVGTVRGVEEAMQAETPQPPAAPSQGGFMNIGKDMIQEEGNNPEDTQTPVQEAIE